MNSKLAAVNVAIVTPTNVAIVVFVTPPSSIASVVIRTFTEDKKVLVPFVHKTKMSSLSAGVPAAAKERASKAPSMGVY